MKSKSKRYQPIVVSAFIMLFCMIFYYVMYNWMFPITNIKHWSLLGADTWKPLAAMDRDLLTFHINEMKHPLFYFLTKVLVKIFNLFINADIRYILFFILSLYSSLDILLVWLILGRFYKNTLHRSLFTLLFFLSFSPLVIFSVPETYAFTSISILAFLFIVLEKQSLNLREIFFASTFAGTAALSNPPTLALLGVLIIMIWQKYNHKRNLVLSATAIFWTTLIYVIPNIWIISLGNGLIELSHDQLKTYASLMNFLNSENYLRLFLSLLVFQFVSPFDTVKYMYPASLQSYFSSYLLILALIVHIIFLILCLRNFNKLKNKNSLAVLAFLIIISLFYVYFSPGEIMLFSIQLFIPIYFLLAKQYEFKNYKYTGFFLTYVIIIGVVNSSAIYNFVINFVFL